MATIQQLELAVRQLDQTVVALEARLRRVEVKLNDAARYLKRADDDDVVTAGRRLG